jgi:hypothetical protein
MLFSLTISPPIWPEFDPRPTSILRSGWPPCHPEERAQRSEGPYDRVHPRCSRQGHPKQWRAPVIFCRPPRPCHPEDRVQRFEGPYVRVRPDAVGKATQSSGGGALGFVGATLAMGCTGMENVGIRQEP